MDVRKGQLFKPFHYWSPTFRVLLLGFLTFFSIFMVSRFELSHYFPIRSVKIYGINHLTEEEVREVLLPLVNHDFFTVNVDSIHDRLLDMAWISDLYVRRVWPDQVIITIKERTPIAHWNDVGLLSKSGVIFQPKKPYSLSLPLLKGPSGKHVFMLQYLNDINRLIAPLNAKIAYLELTPYFTWKVGLDNGVNLQLGYKDILTRLDQFVKVYPKIVGNNAPNVDYIDLRYPNGMAVRWKSQRA